MKKILFFLNLLIFAHLFQNSALAFPPVSQAEANLFTAASGHYQKNEMNKVIELLATHMGKGKASHPYACILYGLAHLNKGQNALAISAFEQGLLLAPEDVYLLQNLAVALMHNKDYAKAAKTFLEAARLSKEDKQNLLYSAAQCFYFANNYSESLKIISPLALGQNAKEDWLNLAAVDCLQLKNWVKAELFFTLLSEKNPTKIGAWKGLAHARLQQGKKSLALASLEIASRLPEAKAQEKRELASLYRASTAPMLSLHSASKLTETPDLVQQRIATLERTNRNKELLSYLDQQITKQNSAELHWVKGTTYYRMGEKQNAGKAMMSCSKFSNTLGKRCRLMAGLIAWEQGENLAAKEILEPLEEDKDFGTQARQALSTLEILEQTQKELGYLPVD